MADTSKGRLNKAHAHCCVPQCTTTGYVLEDDRKVSFHRLPQHQELLKMWLFKIRRDVGPTFKVTKHTRVCSRHFLPSDFMITPKGRRFLKRRAIPSIFKWADEDDRAEIERIQAVPKDMVEEEDTNETLSDATSDQDLGDVRVKEESSWDEGYMCVKQEADDLQEADFSHEVDIKHEEDLSHEADVSHEEDVKQEIYDKQEVGDPHETYVSHYKEVSHGVGAFQEVGVLHVVNVSQEVDVLQERIRKLEEAAALFLQERDFLKAQLDKLKGENH